MNTDDFIQHQIEHGNEMHGADADAYKIVFNSLKKEHNINLSKDFALKVSAMTAPKKSFNWDNFMFAAAGFAFVGALIYAIAIVKPNFSIGAFAFLSGYSGLIAFAIAFILVLNWLDKKLVRQSHS